MASFTIVIYDCHIFIVQVTGVSLITLFFGEIATTSGAFNIILTEVMPIVAQLR